MEDVNAAKLAELLTNLGDADKADVHSAGGAGFLGFLDTGYSRRPSHVWPPPSNCNSQAVALP